MTGRCFSPIDALPPLGDVEIQLENTLLREMLFEGASNQSFPRLSKQGPFGRQVEVFGQLLSKGASSTLEFACFEVIQSRILDPLPVESLVSEERRIFPRHDCLVEVGGDT
jgi:hypothetical protein